VKDLKAQRVTVGEELLEALEEDDVDAVKLADGRTVRRYTAKSTERVTDEFLCEHLAVFLEQHDKHDAPASKRAEDATEFVYAKRSVDESYRLSVKKVGLHPTPA